MGLDGVDLLIEVEEVFGVSIPDQCAAEMRTVGDLYGVIVQAKGATVGTPQFCLSALAFYRIRRALTDEFGWDRQIVRPRLELATKLHVLGRRRAWARLRRALGLEIPELALPRWFENALVFVCGSLGVAACLATWPLVGPLSPIAGIVFFILSLCLAFYLTLPLARCFRPEFASIGALTKAVVARNFQLLSSEVGTAHDQDIWETLKRIIVDQLGVDPILVIPSARFVDDLGIN